MLAIVQVELRKQDLPIRRYMKSYFPKLVSSTIPFSIACTYVSSHRYDLDEDAVPGRSYLGCCEA